MTTTLTVFDRLQEEMKNGGLAALMEALAGEFREEKKYHELFEVMKMQLRHRLGLPLLYNDTGDDLDESVGKQLEDGLIAACREVGEALLTEGRIREGWMYLRPVGEKSRVAELIAEVEVDDENMDEIVEVCLNEGVDPARGYALVLENYGTCNSITTFESSAHQLTREDQQACARLLLKHVHDELKASVVADISHQEGATPGEATIAELVADRDWLFGENSYHIDTTHLASTVRLSRLLDDEPSLRLAIDLTEYGRRLAEQFQYQGDEPFVDIYPSNALFFKAVLGEDVDEALAYFKDKAETVDAYQQGAMPIEVYVDLLARRGKYQEAIDTAISLMPDDVHTVGYAPSLLELSQKAGNYDALLEYCKKRNDVLGYATALAYSAGSDAAQ